MPLDPVDEHRSDTRRLAEGLSKWDVFDWLVSHGYFPESYVLPPCFKVTKRPPHRRQYVKVKRRGRDFKVPRHELVSVHFPKSELTDRNFGIIHPEIHNDIAYHIARNWMTIVEALIPTESKVVSYSFPVPLTRRSPGRLGRLRSGRMIYEFLHMVDDDIAAIAYKYSHLVRTDIKNFYPSIYTHSIAWALHGKKIIRKPGNIHDFRILGNRLDKLFQSANDGCTNGVPIGPVVSDIVAEVIASAVDCLLSRYVGKHNIDCKVIRFKDDYRILTKSESDGRAVVKHLQAALKFYNLELNEEKTKLLALPDGLFREWASKYHAVHPRRKRRYSWKEFRELYLAVLRIDHDCPGTGVIDRFLADIVDKSGHLKVDIWLSNLQKVISMLLLMGNRRIKAFPKVLAIVEAVLKSPLGMSHTGEIVSYLEQYLRKLSLDEERYKYLIAWTSYFLVSNGLKKRLAFKPKYKDLITRSVFSNHGLVFKGCADYKVFAGCIEMGKKVSMLKHLDIFNPPDGEI